jgi:hypothetical protein
MIYLRYKQNKKYISVEIKKSDIIGEIKEGLDTFGCAYVFYNTEDGDYIINKYNLPKRMLGDIVNLNFNSTILSNDKPFNHLKEYIKQKKLMQKTILENRNDKIKEILSYIEN